MLPHSALNALSTMYESSIPAKLKSLESIEAISMNTPQGAITPVCHYVVRIDGVSFKNFLKGVDSPFDDRITHAMLQTTRDLVVKFSPSLGYTQSDEISLVFPAVMVPDGIHDGGVALDTGDEKQRKRTRLVEESGQAHTEPATAAGLPSQPKVSTQDSLEADAQTQQQVDSTTPKQPNQQTVRVHMYNGRPQKIATVIASYTAARFNYHLATPSSKWATLKSESTRTRMTSHTACFDARVIPIRDAVTVMECVFWRSNFDGLRNAVSHIAQTKFPRAKLHGKSVRDQVRMLSDELDVKDMCATWGMRTMFGTWVKKEQYEMHGAIDPRTGNVVDVAVMRSRVRTGSFNWADWNEADRVAFAMSKFWPMEPNAPPMDPEQI